MRGFLKKPWRQRQSSVHSRQRFFRIGEALLHVDLNPKERLLMPTRKKAVKKAGKKAGKSGAKKKATKKAASKKSASSRKRSTAKKSAARRTTKKRSSPGMLKKAKKVLKAVVVGAAAGAAQGAVRGATQAGSNATGLGNTEEERTQSSNEGRKDETDPGNQTPEFKP